MKKVLFTTIFLSFSLLSFTDSSAMEDTTITPPTSKLVPTTEDIWAITREFPADILSKVTFQDILAITGHFDGRTKPSIWVKPALDVFMAAFSVTVSGSSNAVVATAEEGMATPLSSSGKRTVALTPRGNPPITNLLDNFNTASADIIAAQEGLVKAQAALDLQNPQLTSYQTTLSTLQTALGLSNLKPKTLSTLETSLTTTSDTVKSEQLSEVRRILGLVSLIQENISKNTDIVNTNTTTIISARKVLKKSAEALGKKIESVSKRLTVGDLKPGETVELVTTRLAAANAFIAAYGDGFEGIPVSAPLSKDFLEASRLYRTISSTFRK